MSQIVHFRNQLNRAIPEAKEGVKSVSALVTPYWNVLPHQLSVAFPWQIVKGKKLTLKVRIPNIL